MKHGLAIVHPGLAAWSAAGRGRMASRPGLRAVLLVSVVAGATLLAACQSTPPRPPQSALAPIAADKANDVVLYALSLIDVGYVFGGRNPEAGVDCSGLVTLVYQAAAGVKLPHNAARIAELSRPVGRDKLRPGDLVFFNTQNAPFSHVGVFIGDGRFIHAPRSNSAVRIERLDSKYFAARFEGARTLFGD